MKTKLMQVKDSETTIYVLDEATANQIAAGEVIERPSSVVKELVENSLDAGASQIRIELCDGGKRLIRVSDDGVGMSREDALLSIQRHATSKIRFAEDLFDIRTLGFRGEALPSIASVSRFEIITRRPKDEVGTRLVCGTGNAVEVSDIGAPAGTSVAVADLFFNVPARQKFLKRTQTELSHVIDLVNRFAVSHCDVELVLWHNDRQIFQSPGSDRLEDAILTVFGRDAAEAIIPISGSSGPCNVRGFVSKPSYSKPNRSGQFFFVNRRFVRNRSLIHALDEAYRGILPQGRYALIVAFLEVPPELVDVNVHPTKIEVRFAREWEVHNVLASAVRAALSSTAVSPSGIDILPPAPSHIQRPSFSLSGLRSASGSDVTAFRRALGARLEQTPFVPPDGASRPVVSSDAFDPASDTVEDVLGDADVLAQAQNMYIVAQSRGGLLIIDQHVAHERVICDRLTHSKVTTDVQRLMMPLTLVLGRREALVVEARLEDLRSLGFEIETFGKDTFVVRSIPAMIAGRNYEDIIKDTIDELTELTVARRLIVHGEAVIATTACKMAIKAGERLSMDEMARLISDLRQTSNPYLCPHGRPIIICITNRELAKMFGRV